MISHERAQELISARMDAPLTAAEHRELQNHLASCTDCRHFVSQADVIARELQVLPRLAPSPAVSRGVMSAISSSNSGWDWLRGGLRLISSPGMAVATSMALIVALASALIVALNAPGANNPGSGAGPQETITAAEVAQIPTEVPTQALPTATQAAKPTEMAAVAPTAAATKPAGRTIAPPPTRVAKSPTPRPTATSVPIEAVSAPSQPDQDSPIIEQSSGEAPADVAPTDDPVLAMAPDETTGDAGSVDVAQDAAPEVDEAQPVENVDTSEAVDAAPSESTDSAAAPENSGEKNNGKKGDKTANEPALAEAEATRPVGPLPVEAIAALEGAGGVPNINLPPAAPGPMDPMMPDQSFLPVTPTPVTDGTPTPEGDAATQSESPQLAEDGSGDLPLVAEAPSEPNKDTRKVKEKEKRDKSSQAGESHEEKQVAWEEAPMASWSSEPVVIQPMVALPQQTSDQPSQQTQSSDDPAGEATTAGEATDPALTGESAAGSVDGPDAAAEPERQIDPQTGMEIDPATGFLIDPTTGYLIDRANGRVIDPRTGYQVNPMTGLLIDPATGAQLDPNTLAVVVPPGFGSDQPAYVPGSDGMHDQIEGVVDSTYNNATIKIEPPTDGPVQPVGDIVVPTESGDALEIS